MLTRRVSVEPRGYFNTQISRSGRGHESLLRSQCLGTRDLVHYKKCESIVLIRLLDFLVCASLTPRVRKNSVSQRNQTLMQFYHSSELDQSEKQTHGDPGIEQVHRYLMYGLSLPERAVRSTAALVGGAINESATLLVPQAFRDSTTYSKFVQEMLDMLNKDVGGVKLPAEDATAGNSDETPDAAENAVATEEVAEEDVADYVAKKTVGTFIDLAGMATFHLSPITVLAIVSDLAYGSQAYLEELAVELKKEGVIGEESTISSSAELLEVISTASSKTTANLDTPPLSVEGLRETIADTQEHLGKIDPTKVLPQAELHRLWEDMHEMANQNDTSLFEISSTLTVYSLNQVTTATKGALTTVRVTGNLLDQHLFDHYRQGLGKIERDGVYGVLAESSKPYLDALWYNFSDERPTITEDVVSGKMISRIWAWVSGWWRGKQAQ